MDKILKEYGGVIISVVAVVTLIAFVTFSMSSNGVISKSFHDLVGSFVDASNEVVDSAAGSHGGSGGAVTLSGGGQTYFSLSPHKLSFTANTAAANVQQVLVNEEALPETSYSVVEDGSKSQVVLSAGFLNTLSYGTHSVAVVCESGSPSATFNVVDDYSCIALGHNLRYVNNTDYSQYPLDLTHDYLCSDCNIVIADDAPHLYENGCCAECGVVFKGDVDLNGIIDGNDNLLVARHIAKIEYLADAAMEEADFDNDGDVDADDLTVHLRLYKGLKTAYGTSCALVLVDKYEDDDGEMVVGDYHLVFVREFDAPTVGDQYTTKQWGALTIEAVYFDFDSVQYQYDPDTGTVNTPWSEYADIIKRVFIEDKMTVRSTSAWFANFTKVVSFYNLDRLNTLYVSDMSYMFANVGANASNVNFGGINMWSTELVLDMTGMFMNARTSTKNPLDLSGWCVDCVAQHDNFGLNVTGGFTEPDWVY